MKGSPLSAAALFAARKNFSPICHIDRIPAQYIEEVQDVNPDVELIARSIARDPRAFGDLFDRHSTAVFRFAYSLTHNTTEAQELVQETFVTAWKRLADIRLVGDSVL